MTFETVFETILDEIVEGRGVKSYLARDPREIDYGRFMRWIDKDSERVKRYEEAQRIGTEAIMEDMDDIAAGTDSLEEIERSKLRLAQAKFKVQSWNKRKYGDTKQVEMNVTTISMRDLLDQREEQLRSLEGEFRVLDNDSDSGNI